VSMAPGDSTDCEGCVGAEGATEAPNPLLPKPPNTTGGAEDVDEKSLLGD